MKKGTELTITVDRVAEKGRSVGKHEDREVSVAHGVPGDLLRVKVIGRKRKRLLAQVLEILEPSPLRADPRCFYFGTCGGCTRQNLLYSGQLDAKHEMVENAFSEHQLTCEGGIDPVVPCDPIYNYRNKMEFSFGAHRWLTGAEVETGEEYDRSFALGLHVPGHYDRLLDLHECHLPREPAVSIMNGLRKLAKSEGWSPWNLRKNEGFLRHIVIRTPHHFDEVMVNLVTDDCDPARMELVADWLKRDFPTVTTLVNTINRGVALVSTGEEVNTVFGPGVVHDRIGPHTFEIGPHSFFQTNTIQAERLYEVVLEFAALNQNDVVYDLYCGLGTITLHVADGVRSVAGFELDEETVRCARRNAEKNGVENVRFFSGNLTESLEPAAVAETGPPDVVIVDPPRAGIHPQILKKLLLLGAKRIVYVSCNPKTQAHDLALLSSSHAIESARPVDLFPHTDHIENVVSLRRR